jgi:hypothetical protein
MHAALFASGGAVTGIGRIDGLTTANLVKVRQSDRPSG